MVPDTDRYHPVELVYSLFKTDPISFVNSLSTAYVKRR